MSAVANGASDKPSLKELVYGAKNTPKTTKSSKPPLSPTAAQPGLYQSQNQPVKKKGWLPFRRKQSKATNGELRESNRSDSMTNLNIKVDSEPDTNANANANAKAKADVKSNTKKYSNGDATASGASLATQNAKWASLPELSNASGDYRPQPSGPLPAQREEDEPDLPADAKNREASYDTETLQDDSEEMGALYDRNQVEADDADAEKRRRADSPTSIDTFNSILNSFESAIDAGKEAGYSDRDADRILDDAADDTLIESHLSKLRTHNRQTSKASNSLNLASIDEQQKTTPTNPPSKSYEDAKLHSQVQVQMHASPGRPSHRQTSSMTSSGSNTLSEGSTSDSLSVTNSNRLRNQQQIEQAHRFNANQKQPQSASVTPAAPTPVQTRMSHPLPATQSPTINTTTTNNTARKPSKPEDSAPVVEKVTAASAAKLSSPPPAVPAIETITVSSTVKPSPVNGISKLPTSPTAAAPTHQRTSSHDQRLPMSPNTNGGGSPLVLLPSLPSTTATSTAATNTTTRITSASGPSFGLGSAAPVVSTHVRSTSGVNVPSKLDDANVPSSPAAISRLQRASTSDSASSLTTSATAQVDTPSSSATPTTADTLLAADKALDTTQSAASDGDSRKSSILTEVSPQKTPTAKTVPNLIPSATDSQKPVKAIVAQKKVVAPTSDAKSNRPVNNTSTSTGTGTGTPLRSTPSKTAENTQESIVKKQTSTVSTAPQSQAQTQPQQTRPASEQPPTAAPEQERGRSAHPRITTYSKWRQVGPGTNINPHSFISLGVANANLNSTTPLRRTDTDKQSNDAFTDRGRRSQSVGGAKARELENDLNRRERSRSPEIRHRLPLASNSAAQYAEQRKQAEAKRHSASDKLVDKQSSGEAECSAASENDHVDAALTGEQIGFRKQVELKLSNTEQQSKTSSSAGMPLQAGARPPSARPLVTQNSVTSSQKSNELQRSTTAIKQQILPVTQRQQPNRSMSTTNGPQQTVTTTTYVPLTNATQQPGSTPTAKQSNSTARQQSTTQPSATDKQAALGVKTLGTTSTAGTHRPPSNQTQRTSASAFNKTPSTTATSVQSPTIAKSETPIATEQFSSSLELASAAFGVRLAPAERRVVRDNPNLPKRRVTTEISDLMTRNVSQPADDPEYNPRDLPDTSASLLAFDGSEPGQLV